MKNSITNKSSELSPTIEYHRGANRRKILSVLGLGGTLMLPNKWAKPIVDTVIMPAHAQTSDPIAADPSAPSTPSTPPALFTFSPSGSDTFSFIVQTSIPGVTLDETSSGAITSFGVGIATQVAGIELTLISPITTDSALVLTGGRETLNLMINGNAIAIQAALDVTALGQSEFTLTIL